MKNGIICQEKIKGTPEENPHIRPKKERCKGRWEDGCLKREVEFIGSFGV